jgi:ligand-binding SRPBCC domain-containing protein
MPIFESSVLLPRPVAEVFDFFCCPANLVVVSPPELHLRLVDGPERLELGSRITVQGRRWGLSQRVVSEVTVFEPGVRVVDEQREGPFGRFIHEHRFEPEGTGTRVTDCIDFEPPSGLLGRLLTARTIERDLQKVFAYRQKKLAELFGAKG